MVKAVIFDMDGVLVDTEVFYQNRRRRFMEERGYFIPNINWMDFVGENFASLWDRIEKYVDVDYQTLQEQYEAYKESHLLKYEETLIPEAITLIKKLHQAGYQLAVASASSRKDIEAALDTMGVTNYFSSILSGCDIERTKPDPMIYQMTLENLSVQPNEAIVIEDSPVGIKAATGAGIYTIARRHPDYILDQANSDIIAYNYDEIFDIIKEKTTV